MTTKGATPSTTTRFRQNPVSMTIYTLASATILIGTYLAMVFTGIVGHIVIWPLATSISISSITASIGTIVLTLFASAIIWATPYVVSYALASPFTPTTTHNGLRKCRAWGLWALPPALATLALIWFSPLWQPLLPGIGGGLANAQPAGMANNVLSFGVTALPMAATYSLFTHDDLKDDNTGTPTRINTTRTPTSTPQASQSESQNSSTQRQKSQPQENTPSDNAAKNETTDNTSTTPDTAPNLSSYTYNWQKPPELSFSDVGGMGDVKQELDRDIITPLDGNTEKYEEFGVSIPNLLLHGPPGTGKTYMAEALAGELGYPYVKLSASDVTSKWINESGENINTLFSEAAELADYYGYAVVFIDEIDALLADRGMGQQHSENKKVVDEFLNHLSDTSDQNTLFVGATNHFDSLDQAAVRTGRIDKKIHMGLPDLEARVGVFKAQLQSRPGSVPDESKLRVLAEQLEGASCADIGGVVDRAARRAVERDASSISIEDLVQEVEAERS